MRNDYDADDRDDADDDYEGDGLRWMSFVVVLLVIFGFVSLAWYAYRSGASTAVDGDVPVIEADAAPLKVKPSDPGGMDIPNQDKTVYEALSKGDSSSKTEHLMEAAEEPMVISHDDEPKQTQVYRRSQPQPTPDAKSAQTEQGAAPTTAPTAEAPVDDEEHEKVVDDVDTAPVKDAQSKITTQKESTENVIQPSEKESKSDNSTAKHDKPVTAPAKETAQEPEPLATSPQQPAPPAVNASQKAARDAQKTGVQTAAATLNTAAAQASTANTAVQSGAAGIQLAASKSRADAEKAWAKLAAKFPDLLGSRSHAIVAAEVAGKGTYYRIRATGLNPTSAADLCRKLKGRGQDCMVVK